MSTPTCSPLRNSKPLLRSPSRNPPQEMTCRCFLPEADRVLADSFRWHDNSQRRDRKDRGGTTATPTSLAARRINRHRGCAVTILLALSVSVPPPSLAANKPKCAVTKPPNPPFVPPKPYSAFHGEGEFLYGTSALWTVVYPNWHVHSGGKLPFFRQGFDWRQEGRPHLTVVARRIDREWPLVWSGLPGSGSMEGERVEGMFMVTGIDIPSPGCWEIAARYITEPANLQTLTYTVSVSH
jgi:hypothetical protein